jgi:hypothetical protein
MSKKPEIHVGGCLEGWESRNRQEGAEQGQPAVVGSKSAQEDAVEDTPEQVQAGEQANAQLWQGYRERRNKELQRNPDSWWEWMDRVVENSPQGVFDESGLERQTFEVAEDRGFVVMGENSQYYIEYPMPDGRRVLRVPLLSAEEQEDEELQRMADEALNPYFEAGMDKHTREVSRRMKSQYVPGRRRKAHSGQSGDIADLKKGRQSIWDMK